MDKRKLVTIIVKDLEEIRVLSEEVAESEDDSALIIDLALYRARLLCQEIELLRELAAPLSLRVEETEEDNFEREEDQDSDINYPDPELEILNFEDPESSEKEELTDDEDLEEIEEEETEDEEEEDKEDDQTEIEEDDQKEDQELIAEGDLEEEKDLTEEEDSEEEEEEEAEEEETHQPATKIHSTVLINTPQPGVREIHIDEDEDDIEPIRFSPLPGSTVRPPMREIPKPEFLEPENHENEKKLVGEKYQKERSLNDSMGDKKPLDSKLTIGRVTSLRAAIGLNDRFLFIREIFDNNSEKYNKVIDHLDTLEQIQEAVEYLKANLSLQKNEASMKFVELLKRRFTA